MPVRTVYTRYLLAVPAQDRVVPSRLPNSWNLKNIFLMGIIYGLYLTLSTWAL